MGILETLGCIAVFITLIILLGKMAHDDYDIIKPHVKIFRLKRRRNQENECIIIHTGANIGYAPNPADIDAQYDKQYKMRRGS